MDFSNVITQTAATDTSTTQTVNGQKKYWANKIF